LLLVLIDSSAIFSSLISAELADWIGRKKVLLGAIIISLAAVATEFAATTNAVFFVGKLLNGIMVGAIGTIMVSYIGEVGSTRGLVLQMVTYKIRFPRWLYVGSLPVASVSPTALGRWLPSSSSTLQETWTLVGHTAPFSAPSLALLSWHYSSFPLCPSKCIHFATRCYPC
jgi:MFS family permease